MATVSRPNQSSLGELTGLGSGVITWDYRGTNDVQVIGGRGANTFDIQGTVVDTTFDSDGPATMNVGSGGSIAGIQGVLVLDNQTGPVNTININSQNDSRTTTASLNVEFGLGEVFGILTAPGLANEISWVNADTSVVNLNLGKGASTVDVLATDVTTNVSITAPNAEVNVGNDNAAANIQGKLNLLTEASGATVNILDDNDTHGQTATLATVSRPNQSSLGKLTGLGSGVITWDYRGTANVNVVGGSGINTFNIQGTVVDTILGSNGLATMNVGNGGSIAGIQGELGFFGLDNNNNGSLYTVNINSQNDTRATTASLSAIPEGSTDTGSGTLTVPGLANEIVWDNGATSVVNLNLGSGASTVNVLVTEVTTNVFNNGSATIFVGDSGLLSSIQGNLNLNASSSDTIFLDNSSDDVGETFNFNVIPGFEFLNTLGKLGSSAMLGTITWNNAVAIGVELLGGSGGDTYNIFATGSGLIIDGGFGANTFNVDPSSAGILGANIVGPLTLDGGGNAGTTLNLDDLGDPNSETFNFAISTFGTGSLTLGSTPLFSLAFDNMNNGVNLATNGFSTVNDPSGTVNVVS
jgi:hypothetical protein